MTSRLDIRYDTHFLHTRQVGVYRNILSSGRPSNVFARDGKIFAASIKGDCDLVEKLLVDLNTSKPEPLPRPEWATKW
jgi:hypothetical protein